MRRYQLPHYADVRLIRPQSRRDGDKKASVRRAPTQFGRQTGQCSREGYGQTARSNNRGPLHASVVKAVRSEPQAARPMSRQMLWVLSPPAGVSHESVARLLRLRKMEVLHRQSGTSDVADLQSSTRSGSTDFLRRAARAAGDRFLHRRGAMTAA